MGGEYKKHFVRNTNTTYFCLSLGAFSQSLTGNSWDKSNL